MLKQDDFLKILGKNEDLLIVKGQLLRPEPRDKQDGSGYYIVFELKVVKESEGSKYRTQFSSYSVIVPSTDVKQMAPVIKQYKNCEVLAVIRPSARVRKGNNGGKYNSIDLYLEQLFLIDDLAHYAPVSPSAGVQL